MTSRTVDPVYIPFEITTLAGTAIGAPMTSALKVDAGVLEAVDLLIPNGHQGATGIRFTLAGQQILPWSNVAAWIKGNDLRETFDVGVQVDTQLAAVTYNVGAYPHTHYLRCRVRVLALSSGLPTVSLLANASLSSA